MLICVIVIVSALAFTAKVSSSKSNNDTNFFVMSSYTSLEIFSFMFILFKGDLSSRAKHSYFKIAPYVPASRASLSRISLTSPR